MKILDHFANEQAAALASAPPLRDRWRNCSYRIARKAPHLVMHVQQDGYVDLILRAAEAELAANIEQQDALSLGLNHYMIQARYWIFAMFENLRTYCELNMYGPDGQKLKRDDWVDELEAASQLRGQFSLVRVPLAKLEIKGANQKDAPPIQTISYPPKMNEEPQLYRRRATPYYPIQSVDLSTGSACWDVIDLHSKTHVRVSRVSLSDAFLNIFSSKVHAAES
ncbi:MAG TPA: hypothetical protein VGQ97_08180 [Xanthobacteraceae bacterium]|nr:hypothetical protein [Xanthobacteraceae bacterium]